MELGSCSSDMKRHNHKSLCCFCLWSMPLDIDWCSSILSSFVVINLAINAHYFSASCSGGTEYSFNYPCVSRRAYLSTWLLLVVLTAPITIDINIYHDCLPTGVRVGIEATELVETFRSKGSGDRDMLCGYTSGRHWGISLMYRKTS